MASDVGVLDAEFRKAGTARRAAGSKAYLESDLHFHGVTSPDLTRIVAAFDAARPALSRARRLALVCALWTTSTDELRAAGVALLERHQRELRASDLRLLEAMLRASRTWAYVDWLCTRVIAPLGEREPVLKRDLHRWARDDDFWIRRAALLALLPALRRGDGDFALFERLAVPMLGETGFFVRKAIGWVLRDVSHRRPALTAAFVRRHAAALSGVTWREASRYIAPADRAAAQATRERVGQSSKPLTRRAVRRESHPARRRVAPPRRLDVPGRRVLRVDPMSPLRAG